MAGIYLINGLGSLVSSALNTWSSHKNRQSSERISALSRDSSEEVARLSRKHSAELQYNQLKFSVLQQRENQDFQRELAELSHERLKEIEIFRAEVNFAINQKNLDFQKWSFEQRKKIEFEILQLQQNFQRDLSQIQHQNALIQMRERMRADKSPIANLPFDLLENSFAHGVMPLKLFLAPPFLDHDLSTGKPLTSGYETYLAEEIEQFLHQGYLGSHHHPVQLVDRALESKKWGGGSMLQALHGQLKSIPVLVLESDINLGDLVNFKLGYWSAGDVSYTKATILSGQSLDNLLYSVAKNRALEWEKIRQKLQEVGKDEAFIKEKGGQNEENLQIFYEELAEKAEFEQLGIDLIVTKSYKLNNLDYRAFYQYLAVWHCLAIGLYADMLFLGNSWENTPLLPSLIPYLLEKYKKNFLLTPQFWQEAIAKIVTTYGQFYDGLKSDACNCSPEVRMKLALSLANLPNEYKYLALKQCEQAVTDWLAANNVPSEKIFDLDDEEDCQILKGIFYQEDKPFLDSIKQLLAIVKEAENIDLTKLKTINSLLEGWKRLSLYGTIPALPQVEVKPINYTAILPNDIKLKLVKIPAGSFTMGADEYDSEKPQHQVNLQEFYLGKYPVTQEQYQAVMGINPSHFKDNPKNPVENVTWHDAQAFCKKLNQLTGKNFRLPTEAEWEYACRAGSQTRYYFGDDENQLGEYAWFDQNSNSKTHPVGQKRPNNWELYDMSGNIWEWCEDPWHDSYVNKPENIKNNGNIIWSDSNESRHILRGGSWSRNSRNCRSASRGRNYAVFRNNNFGFRLALCSF